MFFSTLSLIYSLTLVHNLINKLQSYEAPSTQEIIVSNLWFVRINHFVQSISFVQSSYYFLFHPTELEFQGVCLHWYVLYCSLRTHVCSGLLCSLLNHVQWYTVLLKLQVITVPCFFLQKLSPDKTYSTVSLGYSNRLDSSKHKICIELLEPSIKVGLKR